MRKSFIKSSKPYFQMGKSADGKEGRIIFNEEGVNKEVWNETSFERCFARNLIIVHEGLYMVIVFICMLSLDVLAYLFRWVE